MKKLVEIPDEIFKILEQLKEKTGRSIMSMIQESVYRWMIAEKLMKIKTVTVKIQTEKMSDSLKFCDGACEVE